PVNRLTATGDGPQASRLCGRFGIKPTEPKRLSLGDLGTLLRKSRYDDVKRRAHRERRDLCALCGLSDDRFHATGCAPLMTTRWFSTHVTRSVRPLFPSESVPCVVRRRGWRR